MAIELNHTIVRARDKQASARFLAELLGLEVGAPFGPFVPVTTDNSVMLDYCTDDAETITPQHYAFLVSEEEFDAALGRIRAAGVDFYGSPGMGHAGEIYRNNGGRGAYFLDPDGHGMEILTRPNTATEITYETPAD